MSTDNFCLSCCRKLFCFMNLGVVSHCSSAKCTTATALLSEHMIKRVSKKHWLKLSILFDGAHLDTSCSCRQFTIHCSWQQHEEHPSSSNSTSYFLGLRNNCWQANSVSRQSRSCCLWKYSWMASKNIFSPHCDLTWTELLQFPFLDLRTFLLDLHL